MARTHRRRPSRKVQPMDYGASFSGDMGQYAIDGATATQAQVKSVLGLSDAAAWQKIAVTPMIGVNDVSTEVFTVADASQLAAFAKAKGLAWLSIRDPRQELRGRRPEPGRRELQLRRPEPGRLLPGLRRLHRLTRGPVLSHPHGGGTSRSGTAAPSNRRTAPFSPSPQDFPSSSGRS
jgi:hypothetical protein